MLGKKKEKNQLKKILQQINSTKKNSYEKNLKIL